MSLLVNLQFNGCQNGYDLTLNHSLSGSSCWGVLHSDFQRGPRPCVHTISLWHSCRQRARWVTSLECSCISCAAGPVLSSYIRAQSQSGAVLGCLSCVNVNSSFWQIHTGTSARGTQCQMDRLILSVFYNLHLKLDLLCETAHHILVDVQHFFISSVRTMDRVLFLNLKP